jgi:hypothetical protein
MVMLHGIERRKLAQPASRGVATVAVAKATGRQTQTPAAGSNLKSQEINNKNKDGGLY